MWKHKTKWLVRGGRKVRCYLCGKKILAKGDLFLFHGDTGYYSHQSCQAESTTISGNERRRAVKKIAVGAAVVGAIAAGAGKFLDVSSQSKNSPAAQTILTSQGLIPPALTSDPANPAPGQMWYRSDAGVMAHFDAVQNRVVYSSEINDGNVNVTSKGIVNGLSVLPNDGKGGFGPDTKLGATAPGQYGSPYTKSSGIMESFNGLPQILNTTLNTVVPMGKVVLIEPTAYICSVPIIIYDDWDISIEGVLGASGNSSMYMTTIVGANNIGGLLCVPCQYEVNNPSSAYGGQLILKNFTVQDSYNGTVYPYSTGYVDLLGHTINYLAISVNATPDTLIVDNVSFACNTSSNNSGAFFNSNDFETVWEIKYMWGNASTINHAAFYFSAFHTIIGTIDIGANTPYPSGTLPSSLTQYPTISYSYGPRNFVDSMHIGGNAYYPLTIGPNSSPNYACFINNIFFELSTPPLLSSGYMPQCSTPNGSGENMGIQGHVVIGAINGQPTPLMYGFLPWAGSDGQGASVLEILSIASEQLGTPFSSHGVGWEVPGATGSPPQGVKLPSYLRHIYTSADLAMSTFNPPTSINPISSGTVYKNPTIYDWYINIPITFPTTADTAVTAYLRVGTSSTAGDNPIMDQFSEPATLATANGRTWTLKAKVPSGQYLEVDVTNATIGTAMVVAA